MGILIMKYQINRKKLYLQPSNYNGEVLVISDDKQIGFIYNNEFNVSTDWYRDPTLTPINIAHINFMRETFNIKYGNPFRIGKSNLYLCPIRGLKGDHQILVKSGSAWLGIIYTNTQIKFKVLEEVVNSRKVFKRHCNTVLDMFNITNIEYCSNDEKE
jgi:hypothetical protein